MINDALDRFVLPLHTRCRARGIVPHAAVWGLAFMALPVAATLASITVGTPPWVAPLAIFGALLGYLTGYMPLKQRLFPGARRKLLVDLVAFVAPAFFSLGWLLGVAPSQLGLVFAVVIFCGVALLRLGCFFGGCCHGRPSRIGVKYPGRATRVIPLPLLEAGMGAMLLLCIAAGVALGLPERILIATAGLAYVGYRFGAEFFRARRGPFAVRRFLALSITQWLCLVLMGAATAFLLGGAS